MIKLIGLITDLVDKYVTQVVKNYGIGWGVAVAVLIIVVVVAVSYFFGAM